MSKSTKTRQREKRRKDKATKKDAARALYESWSKSGNNQKRANGRSENGPTQQRGLHLQGPCGNIGCRRCFPKFNPQPSYVSVPPIFTRVG
jgi:hypothetical protein